MGLLFFQPYFLILLFGLFNCMHHETKPNQTANVSKVSIGMKSPFDVGSCQDHQVFCIVITHSRYYKTLLYRAKTKLDIQANCPITVPTLHS